MGKCRVVIAGSVNNDFEPLEKLTDQSLERDGPTGRESGRGWPISCGRSGRYNFTLFFVLIGYDNLRA